MPKEANIQRLEASAGADIVELRLAHSHQGVRLQCSARYISKPHDKITILPVLSIRGGFRITLEATQCFEVQYEDGHYHLYIRSVGL